MALKRAPLAVVGVALACASVGIAPAALAQENAAPAVDPSLTPYASTKDSAQLPDGRAIHLVCMGQGSPTVILTTGANSWSIAWNRIQPAAAAKTRVCAWDRAGFGLSTGVLKPQTVDQTTADLQAALAAGRIDGPYVLVGASMGGWESLLLKDRMVSKVVGMVLVDPSFPDQNARQERVYSPALKAWDDGHPPPFIPAWRKCAAALRAGTVRPGGPDPDRCLSGPRPPTYPPELNAALDRVQAERTPEIRAATLEGMLAGPELNAINSKVTIKPNRNYGNMPLIVLTASQIGGVPGIPAALQPDAALMQAEWRKGHRELVALSTRGEDRIIEGAPHDIASARPQVVIDAIDQVVDAARASGPR
jgi:pimeloyl-ACP methyl ester carboxylesterase